MQISLSNEKARQLRDAISLAITGTVEELARRWGVDDVSKLRIEIGFAVSRAAVLFGMDLSGMNSAVEAVVEEARARRGIESELIPPSLDGVRSDVESSRMDLAHSVAVFVLFTVDRSPHSRAANGRHEDEFAKAIRMTAVRSTNFRQMTIDVGSEAARRGYMVRDVNLTSEGLFFTVEAT